MIIKKTAAIDREEGEFLVCIYDDSAEQFLLNKKDFPLLSERDIIEVCFEDEKLLSVTRLDIEREKRLKKNSERLARLFNKNK
jgi:hypothetical protein